MKIRSVHPEFFTDPKVAQLSHDARLLYIGLWCCADDYGRGRYLLKAIEGDVFPHDVVDIQRLMWELEKRRFIRLYEVDGERFYEIPKWEEWQKPNYRAKTSIPEPGTYISTEDFALSQNLLENSEKTRAGEGEGEGEGEGATTVEFSKFNAERAVAKVRERKKKGLPVKSDGGLARTIQQSAEHIEESRALFAHRDCVRCEGTGEIKDYAPGTGGFKRRCEEVVRETV